MQGIPDHKMITTCLGTWEMYALSAWTDEGEVMSCALVHRSKCPAAVSSEAWQRALSLGVQYSMSR